MAKHISKESQKNNSSLGEGTCIAIPCYNEIDSLEGTVRGVLAHAPGVNILVVDDNSPDGTGELAERLAAEDPRVFVMHRPGKQGLGPAYLAAFDWAAQQGKYRWVGEFDADGSHLPEQLPRLLALACGPSEPDLVIGARWIPGGATRGWPLHRQLLSRGGNLYIRMLLGMGRVEATAGMRIYRLDFLPKITDKELQSQGYSFQIEMTYRAFLEGAQICQCPITFVERKYGKSKMSGKIVFEALFRAMRWRLGY